MAMRPNRRTRSHETPINDPSPKRKKKLKIKVCGTREPGNIKNLLKLPIDMIGFIFHPGSPRFVGGRKDLVDWIKAHEEAFAGKQRVGVFVNAEIDEILNAVHDYGLDLVQLHGSEPPEYLRELSAFWEMSSLRRAGLVKAFGVDETFDLNTTEGFAPFCSFFVFDTKTEKHGGSGRSFNWSVLDPYEGETPFLLSGGIGPDSVETLQAWKHPRWMGIDINSRFETEPGIKNLETLENFIKQIQ